MIALAYLASQQRWVDQDSITYLMANLFGAIFVLASLSVDWNLPAALVEGFWALVSLRGLYIIYMRQIKSGDVR
ncbi:hypothetical protein LNAOJCKE_4105 [Methylorubrum aminovorans]|uniref:CBU-0592-like domain-containing protein n=2 Tax=Methylorubrum aminovorans TaxID=269069 RepID=A0ABQ4UHV1_9HYPH|nr:hypothetical protein LNAOJCKE_4105 [Methylorubrum aminovorans]